MMLYTFFVAVVIILVVAIIIASSEKQQVSLIMTLLAQKDRYSYNHCMHVAILCGLIYNKLPKDIRREVSKKQLAHGALVHDAGKIRTPDSILHSESNITSEELDEVKRHTIYGHKLLIEIEDYTGAVVAYTHHEREDGKGYWGLKSSQVSWYSKIIAVADAFSAMVSKERIYASPMSIEDAIVEIKENSGTQFNPRVVEAFCRISTSDLINTANTK